MKSKKGEANFMAVILGLIVLILIGIAFTTTVANTKATQTSLFSASNESTNLATSCYTSGGQVNESNSACNITVTNWYAAGDWRLSNSQCYLTSVSLKNDTGTALTVDTDYNLYASSGIIQLLNTATTANSSATLANNDVGAYYSYCGASYLTSSGDRGLANLWTFMMILVILGSIIGVVYKMYNQ